ASASVRERSHSTRTSPGVRSSGSATSDLPDDGCSRPRATGSVSPRAPTRASYVSRARSRTWRASATSRPPTWPRRFSTGASIGKAVHGRWTVRRSFYQSEINALLTALGATGGRMPNDVSLRVQGLLGRLYREWFPRTWRREPTYAEILADFRWWLSVAERWS